MVCDCNDDLGIKRNNDWTLTVGDPKERILFLERLIHDIKVTTSRILDEHLLAKQNGLSFWKQDDLIQALNTIKKLADCGFSNKPTEENYAEKKS